MSDIAYELRVMPWSTGAELILAREAVAEIERLRAGIHEVRDELLSPTGSWEKVVGKAVGKIDAIEGR